MDEFRKLIKEFKSYEESRNATAFELETKAKILRASAQTFRDAWQRLEETIIIMDKAAKFPKAVPPVSEDHS